MNFRRSSGLIDVVAALVRGWKVDQVMRHQAIFQHYGDPVLRIVDQSERRNAARFDPEQLHKQVRLAEADPPDADFRAESLEIDLGVLL